MDLITIKINPRWGKSRGVVALLNEKKINFRKVEYLKTGFTKEIILSLSKKLNKKPIDFIRKDDIDFKISSQSVGANSDQDIIKLIIKYPKIIERPIVVMGERAIIGRPPENILRLLSWKELLCENL